MNYRELLKKYGLEYLSDIEMWEGVRDMSDINYMFKEEPLNVLKRASKGYDYTLTNEEKPFNPNQKYFAFDIYGRLISIDSKLLPDFIETELNVDEEDFMDWCEEKGYID